MRRGELHINYNFPRGINIKLDVALAHLLEEFGYEFQGGECALFIEGGRHLAFKNELLSEEENDNIR